METILSFLSAITNEDSTGEEARANLLHISNENPVLFIQTLLQIINERKVEGNAFYQSIILLRTILPKDLILPFTEEFDPLLSYENELIDLIFTTLHSLLSDEDPEVRRHATHTLKRYCLFHEAFRKDSPYLAQIIQELANEETPTPIKELLLEIVTEVITEYDVEHEKSAAICQFIFTNLLTEELQFSVEANNNMLKILASLTNQLFDFVEESFIETFFNGLERLAADENYLVNCYDLWNNIITSHPSVFVAHSENIIQISLSLIQEESLTENKKTRVLTLLFLIFDNSEEFSDIIESLLPVLLPVLLQMIATFEQYEENECSVEYLVICVLCEMINCDESIIASTLIPFCESCEAKQSLYVFLAIGESENLDSSMQSPILEALTCDDRHAVYLALKVIKAQHDFLEKEAALELPEALLQLILSDDEIIAKEAGNAFKEILPENGDEPNEENNQLFYSLIQQIVPLIDSSLSIEQFSSLLEALTNILEKSNVHEFAALFCDESQPLFAQFIDMVSEVDKNNPVFRYLISFITELFQILRTDFAPFVEYTFNFLMSLQGTGSFSFAIYSLGLIHKFTRSCTSEQIEAIITLIIQTISEGQNEQEVCSSLNAGSFLATCVDLTPYHEHIFPQCLHLIDNNDVWGDIKSVVFEFLFMLISNASEPIPEENEILYNYAFNASRELIDIYKLDDETAQQLAVDLCQIFSHELASSTEKENAVQKTLFLIGQINNFQIIDEKLAEFLAKLFFVLMNVSYDIAIQIITDNSMNNIITALKRSELFPELRKRLLAGNSSTE